MSSLEFFSDPIRVNIRDGMTALKDYQRYAARCLEEARNTVDPRHKAFLVEMGQAWQRLADQAANVTGTKVSPVSEPDRGD